MTENKQTMNIKIFASYQWDFEKTKGANMRKPISKGTTDFHSEKNKKKMKKGSKAKTRKGGLNHEKIKKNEKGLRWKPERAP